jgi:S1-C subfamily serine protease
MKNLLNKACLLLVISTFILLNSCAQHLKAPKTLAQVKKSIFKIEVWFLPPDCNEDKQVCQSEGGEYQLFSTGSAAWVRYKGRKVLLTAAHICDFGPRLDLMKELGGKVKIEAVDRINRVHTASQIKYDQKLDLCLLEIRDINFKIPALNIATKAPEYAERHYNLGAPLGVIDGAMVPVFEGFFMGDDHEHAFYSIPAVGGSSGSPIVNSRGELVGMIHSVHFRMHHISLSPRYVDLWNFLKK